LGAHDTFRSVNLLLTGVLVLGGLGAVAAIVAIIAGVVRGERWARIAGIVVLALALLGAAAWALSALRG
jgi:hypothetical protein